MQKKASCPSCSFCAGGSPPISFMGCSLTATLGPQKYCCVAKGGKQTAVFPGVLKQEAGLCCISIESPSHMGTVCVDAGRGWKHRSGQEASFDVLILGVTIRLTSYFCRWISGCVNLTNGMFFVLNCNLPSARVFVASLCICCCQDSRRKKKFLIPTGFFWLNKGFAVITGNQYQSVRLTHGSVASGDCFERYSNFCLLQIQ